MRPLSIAVPLLVAAALVVPALGQETRREPPTGAGILAEQLREGAINPGNRYDMEVGSRFHRIHTRYMAMGCQTCHAGVRFPDNVQFLRREEFPLSAYPGAVDRSTCLGCHRGEGSMATQFYHVPGR